MYILFFDLCDVIFFDAFKLWTDSFENEYENENNARKIEESTMFLAYDL